MKRFSVAILILGFAISAFASGSFRTFIYHGPQWTTSYSEKIGNFIFLETLGTTGWGGAVGFSNTAIDRQKVGFLNLMVGKTTYTAAIGLDINPLTPVGYFEYESMRTIAPIFYDLDLTLGNYGLPNFGVDFNGRTQFVFSNFSLYAQTHFYLVFTSDLQDMTDIEVGYSPIKASFLSTTEVGNLYFLTGGFEFKNLGFSVDLGAGFNANGVGLGMGISSAQQSLENSWTVRFMPSNSGYAVYAIFTGQNERLTLGYNIGSVYLSIEN